MVKPKKRRQANVRIAQQLLQAVSYIRQQKQIPNIERIRRYMQREHEYPLPELSKQLTYTVSDGFLIHYTAVGNKGAKVGVEQVGYRLPTEDEIEASDGHDWYCFECHKPGEVLECSDCWRVFHPSCISSEDTSGAKYTCAVCKAGKAKNALRKSQLNQLLGYTILRLKEKTRELHHIASKNPEPEFDRFVYQPTDLNLMEEKVEKKIYKCLEEFHADARTILHNVLLIHGDDKGGMAELARIMIKDCLYDLDEIKQCSHCYLLSNAKPKHWFCQPCSPPHDLVYAKQKGFSYWPAKVIRDYGDRYDVRFFGGYHQRAVIPMEYIKPISVNMATISVKKTSGFLRACEELKLHQKLLANQAKEKNDPGKESSQSEEEEEEEEGEEGEEEEEEGEEEEEEEEEKTSIEMKKAEREEKEKEKEKERGKRRRPAEWDEDTDRPQVSSTSAIPPKRRSTAKGKARSPDEAIVVTSSEDKVVLPTVAKVSAACQTIRQKVQNTSTQTDESSDGLQISSTTVNGNQSTSSGDSHFMMRLEKKFQEEKEKALKEQSERLQKDFEEDKQQAVSRAMSNMKQEIERAQAKVKEQYMDEMRKLATKHKNDISQTKKKQWCFNCEEEAMYHCCWNTSYCSVKCQQEHWHKEHKKVCRRKR